MSPGGGSAAAVVALLVFLLASRALRAEPVASAPDTKPRIVLLATTSDDPLAGRIDAEMRNLGFDVFRAPIPPERSIEDVVRGFLAGGARAAVVADGHRTDVWIAEPGSDRVALRQELEVQEISGMSAVLALRTVEFLRISLGLGASPIAPPPSSVAVVLPPPGPRSDRWLAAEVSSGLLAATGGLAPVAIVGLALRARPARVIGAEILAYAPLTSADLSSVDAGGSDQPPSQGQSHTTEWLAGGGLLFAPQLGRVAFEAAAGAVAVLVRSTATVTGGGTGGSDHQLRVAGYGQGAARLRLGARWSLRVDLLGGVMNARVTLTDISGKQNLAAFGPVFLAGLGGAELRF